MERWKTKKDENNSPAEFRQSMEGFGSVYESVFQTAMKLCIEMNLNDESEIAAKKIISYNPSNQEIAETFPEIENVANFISTLILEKIRALSLHNIDNNVNNHQNQNKESSLIEENGKEDFNSNTNRKLNEKELNVGNRNCEEFSSKSVPWNILGNCYLLLGDFPNAFAALSQYFQIKYNGSFKSLKNNEGKNGILDENIFFWFSFGIINAHYKYHKNAISSFQKFIVLCEECDNMANIEINNVKIPRNVISDLKNEAIFRLAISFRGLGQYEDSLKSFQAVATKPPLKLQIDDILFQIAYSFQIMKEFTKAQNIYNDIYQRHPDNFNIIVQFGWGYITQYIIQNKKNESLYNEGLRLLLKAHKSFKTNPLVLFLLGKVMMIKEDYQTAYSYFKNCINYWTDSASFWCDLGVLYFKNNQYPDALVAFQTALCLSSDLYDAWLNLGTIFEKMGQYQNAKKIYLTAKNMCKLAEKESTLSDRIRLLQNFENSKNHKIDNEIICLQGEQDFTQLPLEFTNNFVAAVPRILPAFIDIHDQIDINLEVLSSYPPSMF